MQDTFSAAWVREHYRKMGRRVPEDVEQQLRRAEGLEAGQQTRLKGPEDAGEATNATGKRRKYGNEPVEIDGKRFDSKHEAEVWLQLKARRDTGELRAVMCQVRFPLPGKTWYVADFMVVKADGTFEVLDAKSPATASNPVYRMKKRQMLEVNGIDIVEV